MVPAYPNDGERFARLSVPVRGREASFVWCILLDDMPRASPASRVKRGVCRSRSTAGRRSSPETGISRREKMNINLENHPDGGLLDLR